MIKYILLFISFFFLPDFIHLVVLKHFYCRKKKECDNCYKCHYWNCKNFDNCQFNGLDNHYSTHFPEIYLFRER